MKECILAIREETIHGIVLAGGSAFGLGAADGVMQYLEERDIGFDVGPLKVPLVCHCQADLFDLTVGSPDTSGSGYGLRSLCQRTEGKLPER